MIGCVIAMDSEAEILLESMKIENTRTMYGKTVRVGTAFGHRIALTVCGVGKVNAAAGACAAISAGADVILNFGVAGGLKPENTEVGEVYLIDRAVQYDFDLTQLNGTKIGTLDGETENFLPLFCPPLLDLPKRALGTGDRFNDSPDDHALAGLPLCSVKAISDVYGSGSTTEMFKRNYRNALLNMKTFLPDISDSLEK